MSPLTLYFTNQFFIQPPIPQIVRALDANVTHSDRSAWLCPGETHGDDLAVGRTVSSPITWSELVTGACWRITLVIGNHK